MKSFQLHLPTGISRRWIGFCLFLTVFFLPLHFHAVTAASPQLSKECACVQGHRTQFGQIDQPVTGVEVVSSLAIVPFVEKLSFPFFIHFQLSRAPPLR